jgi:predicted anti-sigma-YlaC factor YlaD
MDCTKHRRMLLVYIDGETSSFESAAVEAHLKKCSSCRSELSELYTLSSMIEESSIMASVMAESGEAAYKETKSRKKLIGFGSVAAALVAGLMVFAVMTPSEQEKLAAGNEKLERYVFEHVASTYDDMDSNNIGVVSFGK